MQKLATERIDYLLGLAEQEFERHPERSKRYAQICRKLQQRSRAKMPRKLKESVCKKCGAYWKKGKNVQVELEGTFKVFTCGECDAKRKTRA
ncbi:MAG: ribonuclease P [Candidatus Diapherotrites archaeon]